MITAPDFQKKQMVFVFFNEGEKLAISNDNIVVRDAEGKIKLQCSCYRVFLIFAVGNFSITSVVIQKAQRFGFYIACMTGGFRLNAVIGAAKDGNTMLKAKQYANASLDIGKHIIQNKISNQRDMLACIRYKSDLVKEGIARLNGYLTDLNGELSLQEIMAYEGLAAKTYFKCFFNNVEWQGRQPRVKRDFVNATLDIGYSLLFTLVDCLAQCYGFDTYVGVLHRQFYMRKSLICDLVEPFRPIIDEQVKKGINLKQIKEDDFVSEKGQWKLKYDKSAQYVRLFMSALLERRAELFEYVRCFYQAFMKGLSGEEFPFFKV